MDKQVNIADLKSHLSEHLRSVRAGQPLIVMDRNTPIAKIVPYDAPPSVVIIRSRRPGAPLFKDIPMPPPVDLGGIDILEVLREEREEDDEWE